MLDRFIVGRVTRISPEAPVPVVRFESEYVRLGGAANVAHNIAALGGRVSLVGMVGADAAAAQLRAQLTAAGVAVTGSWRTAIARPPRKSAWSPSAISRSLASTTNGTRMCVATSSAPSWRRWRASAAAPGRCSSRIT